MTVLLKVSEENEFVAIDKEDLVGLCLYFKEIFLEKTPISNKYIFSCEKSFNIYDDFIKKNKKLVFVANTNNHEPVQTVLDDQDWVLRAKEVITLSNKEIKQNKIPVKFYYDEFDYPMFDFPEMATVN